MNLFEKLLAITNEIGTVNKNLIVGEGKAQYKAVGEADVLKAVRELENKYKVYSYPMNREIVNFDTLQTEKEFKGEITRNNKLFLRIKTIYRFVNVENPEEYIDIISYGDGVDTQDKAPGKAMTYSDKYALLKAYKIVTGDDPDQEKSPENTRISRAKLTDKITDTESKSIYTLMQRKGLNVEATLNSAGLSNTSELNRKQFMELFNKLKEMPDKIQDKSKE